MDRLTMLEKAQQIAYEQIGASSALSEKRHKELCVLLEEEALYALAYEFLDNATFDIESTLEEIREMGE